MFKKLKQDFVDDTKLLNLVLSGKRRLLPGYLWRAWLIITVILFLGVSKFNYIDLSKFSISSYLSVSISGLSFTFALFNISKGTFEKGELKQLNDYEDKDKKIKKGQYLAEYLAPFTVTAFILLMTSIGSLIGPFVSLTLNNYFKDYLKVGYLSLLLLGIFSLFNLTSMAIEDVFYKSSRL